MAAGPIPISPNSPETRPVTIVGGRRRGARGDRQRLRRSRLHTRRRIGRLRRQLHGRSAHPGARCRSTTMPPRRRHARQASSVDHVACIHRRVRYNAVGVVSPQTSGAERDATLSSGGAGSSDLRGRIVVGPCRRRRPRSSRLRRTSLPAVRSAVVRVSAPPVRGDDARSRVRDPRGPVAADGSVVSGVAPEVLSTDAPESCCS